jgi:ArsR family metal-binding transcriptional regulator
MVQSLFTSKTRSSIEKQKGLLSLELAEVKEISEMIFKRLEKKIRVIEALEASVDNKISALERLVQRAEAINTPGGGLTRQHEIIALQQKGLDTMAISEVLDMPQGEVALILDLHMQKA